MFLNSADSFDWTIPNKRSINEKINGPDGLKVYSYEPYAQELADLYFGSVSGITSNLSSKDLYSGEVYECTITHLSEDTALAQTDAGQTVYIDLKKEMRDSQKLNLEAFTFKIGDVFKVRVRKIGSTYTGSIVEYFLQSLRAELFEQIKTQSSAYLIKVESINKGGYIVDLSGVKCFMPGSLAAANRITDFESYIGKEMNVMVEGYVEAKDIFIVSYKKYLSRIMESKIKELDLTKKYKGFVTGTSQFGVFVEWEGVYTGLIHKTEFGEDTEAPSFIPGDEVEFYIKEIKDNNRLTLTLEKPLERNVIIQDLDSKIKEGTIEPIEAKVKFRRKNGALVELTPFGIMALIPQEKFGKKEKYLKPGDELLVSVYEVELTSGKIFAEPVNE